MHPPLLTPTDDCLPPPRPIPLLPITSPLQHIHDIPPNRGQELPAVERPTHGEIQVRQSRIRMPCNQRVLVGRDGVPAETDVVSTFSGFEDLWETLPDGGDGFLGQFRGDFTLVL